MTGRARVRRRIALAGLLVAGAPAFLAGQDGFPGAAVECAAPDPQRRPLCLEGLTVYGLARGALVAGMAGGAPAPGTASTLGQRVPGSPRVALGGGLIVQGMALPGLAGRSPDGVTPLPEVTGVLAGVRAGAVVGVFQGFSRGPTVGGILSTDLLANVGYLSLPGSLGFEEGVLGYGIGARIGVLRESFTLPGISLSAVRHGVGEAEVVSASGPRLSFRSRGWSLRGVVGKDVLGFGLHAGAGVNRAAGRLVLHETGPVGGGSPVYRRDGLPTTRPVLFTGATYTQLVFQVTGEVGWTGGEEALAGRPPGSMDPGGGRLFGQLQGRIVF
jgi:hypothetical protein